MIRAPSDADLIHEDGNPHAAPRPGDAATRTYATELDYLRRAMQLEVRASRVLGVSDPDPLQVVSFAVSHQTSWTKRTWRLYKAALLFRYGHMGTPVAQEACALLRVTPQTPCLKRSSKTSSIRPKRFADEDLEAVVERLEDSRSPCASILQQWLLNGAVFGLRPHEWATAKVVFLRSADLATEGAAASGIWETPRPFLRVRNSKATNGRAHGQFRHLQLVDFSPERVVHLQMFVEIMTNAHDDGMFNRLMRQCTDVLYRINRTLHPKDKSRWIHLYSMRHRVSSNAKLHMSKVEVAAIMGHKTNKTATEHYGRRRSAKGGLEIKPIMAEVRRVKALGTAHPEMRPVDRPTPSTNLRPKSDT
jgi:hypothetical protein